MTSDQTILRELFAVALAASKPDSKFGALLPTPPKGRTIVIGAGKAAASMARAFETEWEGLCEGLVVTRYGHSVPTQQIEVVEAAHPVPDEAGLRAAERIFALAQSSGPDDLVVCLMSGGASSLLTLPAPGLTLADKQEINRQLLKSGAPISAMNRMRRALSSIKGGRLAAAASPASLVTYVISDVPGDDPAVVGSGPTIPEVIDPDAVLQELKSYGILVPERVEKAIRANSIGSASPSGPVHLIATPRSALVAAAQEARMHGLNTLILGDAIEGEAREVASVMAGIVRSVALYNDPVAKPCVLLSGGETTVTVRGKGRGGRNAEFLLALATALKDESSISALACDTDGIDGSETNAGAWIDATFVQAARDKGLDLLSHLDDNDAYSAFAALDRLIVTGPTLTNVNDFRAIIVR